MIESYFVFVFALVAIATYMAGNRYLDKAKKYQPGRWSRRKTASFDRSRRMPDIGDSANQLRIVSMATFKSRRLLSKQESLVFEAVEQSLKRQGSNWRVMAQVSLGEVLTSPDPDAYRSINSKRVDMLIVSETNHPVAAVEYQGGGHYQGDAAARDAVKCEALRKAGIGFVEIGQHDSAAEVDQHICRLIKVAEFKRSSG
jgi:hypothetical protein